MSVSFYILGASGRLEQFRPLLLKSLATGRAAVEKKLLLPNIDVVIEDNPTAAIPETGVGGYAPSAHLLYIHIDPQHKGLEGVLASEIKSTLAHELHHCARWASIGYGHTLPEALVSEGLADHFDIEINGGDPKLWSIAIQGNELEILFQKAKQEFNNPEYNHSAWFYGSAETPRWAGYSLGFQIVSEYIKKSGKNASELVSEPASVFVTS